MARSLRSKRKQSNKRKLRADVFAPVETSRTARLAAAQNKIAEELKKVDEPKLTEEPTPASREAAPMEDDTLQNGSRHRCFGTFEGSP